MGIAEMGFYFLLEIQAPFFQAYRFLKIFFLIQILGIIEKCIGQVLVYPFLGVFFFIKSAKRMCICEYVIFGIDPYKKCVFRFEKGYKQIIALGSYKTIASLWSDLTTLDECQVCEIQNGSKCFFLIVLYCSPSQSIEQFFLFRQRSDETIININDCSPTIAIYSGAFNARNSEW